jgi:NAD(P)-dependent dehydrogenase (short-subunit alcohol dehydrogenase family)
VCPPPSQADFSERECKAAVAAVETALGPIDVLVNNAGITPRRLGPYHGRGRLGRVLTSI